MQDTINRYTINRTSLLDKWMISDDSEVIVEGEIVGTLGDIGSDWNTRYLLAITLYLHTINVLDEMETDAMLERIFLEGDAVGQVLLSPYFVDAHRQIEQGKIPDAIAHRIGSYTRAIQWTVTKLRIPVYPPGYSDNIRPLKPGHPPTFDELR